VYKNKFCAIFRAFTVQCLRTINIFYNNLGRLCTIHLASISISKKSKIFDQLCIHKSIMYINQLCTLIKYFTITSFVDISNVTWYLYLSIVNFTPEILRIIIIYSLPSYPTNLARVHSLSINCFYLKNTFDTLIHRWRNTHNLFEIPSLYLSCLRYLAYTWVVWDT